jgi:hypothetical protein
MASAQNNLAEGVNLFSGCDNGERAPSTSTPGTQQAQAAPVVDRFTERAFASFSLEDIERGAASDSDTLCWSRLDGIWRVETPITLADGQVDESLWGSSGPALMKLANGNFTTPRHLVVVTSPKSDDTLYIATGLGDEQFVRFQSSDGLLLQDVLRRSGPSKTFRASGPFSYGNNLTLSVTSRGRIRIQLGGFEYRRPKPNNSLEKMASQEPSDHPYLLSQNLAYLSASHRGYDIAMQDPLYLYENNKLPIFARLDSQKYYTAERHIIPVNFKYVSEGAQGTIYRKSLVSSEEHIQETSAHTFGASVTVSGGGQNLSTSNANLSATAGFSATKETSQSMSSSNTVAQAVGYSRHKKYSLIIDHPYAQLTDAFVEAVDDARNNFRYQALIDRFGTHYPYAVTYGATARMTHDLNASEYSHRASTNSSYSANAGATIYGVQGEVNVSAQSGRSTGSSGTMSDEKTTFVAVGGNGSWDQNGYSAGEDHYPILLDLRPISDLLNPMYFPGQPDIYVTVRKNLEAATRRYLAGFVSDPEKTIQTVSWLPEVEVEPIEVWRVYIRHIWCAGFHVSAKYALASSLEIQAYTGTGDARNIIDSTIKTEGLKTQKCALKSTQTRVEYGRPGYIEIRGTRSELAAVNVDLNMDWHYNKSSNKKRHDKKTFAGKFGKEVDVGHRIDEVWIVKGSALPQFELRVRFKRVK